MPELQTVRDTLAAVSRARPDLARIAETIDASLDTSSPEDIRRQMAGLMAAIEGGA